MFYTKRVSLPRIGRNARFGSRGSIILLTLIVAPLVTAVAPSSAATYYVDATQGDDNKDGSAGSPWKTISHAASHAANGSTVYLRNGNYGAVSLAGIASTRTNWDSAILFTPAPGHTPVFGSLQVANMPQAYVRFDGITIQCQARGASEYGCKVLDASHVRMMNLDITGQWDTQDNSRITGFGVWVVGSNADVSDVLIEGCTITQVSIATQVDGRIRSGLVFRRNTAEKINSSLMRFTTDLKNDTILVEYNNVAEYHGIGDPHGSGLSIRNGNMTIRGNTIRAYGGSGGIRFYQNSTNTGGVPDEGYCNILCESNLIYGSNVSNGIFAVHIGHDFIFRNNTFVSKWVENPPTSSRWRYAGAASFGLDPDGTGTNVKIHNNIFAAILEISPDLVEAGVQEDHNIIWALATGKLEFRSKPLGAHSTIVCSGYRTSAPFSETYFETPGKVFAGGSSFAQAFDCNVRTPNLDAAFQLASGAIAIDAGSTANAAPSCVEGFARTDATNTKPDIGAYEYRGSTPVGQDPDPGTPVDPTPDVGEDSNSQPVLATIGNKSVNENASLTFTISATDADSDAITYSATGLPTGARFSNQTFSWTPTYTQAGSYQVTFIASDGQGQDSETITITVANVNRAPTLGQVGDRSVDENRSLTFAVSASDPDGDAVTYSASGLPSGANFAGGSFSWTPSSSQVGSHNVTFVVSDGSSQDSETVTLFVVGASPDGTAPVVARRSPEPDAIQVSLNNLVTLHVTDKGKGVDADSVVIRVDDNIVYQGDTDSYESPYGRCSRSGTPNDYRFIYQADHPFDFDHTVTVQVSAADREGNAMSAHSYSFTTDMRAFGSSRAVSTSSGVSGAKSSPATVGDAAGNVWAVWCSGAEGSRDIYVSPMAAGAEAFASPAPVTTAASDQCHPGIARDRDGNLYVAWQDKQRGNWDIFFAMSSDGITWSRPIQVTDSDHNETHPAIAADGRSPSRVYIVWQDDRDGQADIFAISSTNAFVDTLSSRLTTDPADQITPDVAFDAESTAYVVWTDMRKGQADIYGSSSQTSGWGNIPIVTTNSAQTSPTLAIDRDAATLHLLWMDNAPGDTDIYYAALTALPGSPITGVSIIDDTSGADQRDPAIACADGSRVFACWQDHRHSRQRTGDTDLFMAELGPAAAGTNIFVGDDGTNSGQSEPAIGIDGYGNPYVVWTDARGSRTEIYSAATTFVDPNPLDAKQVIASVGATIGIDPAAIDEPDDVSIIVPAGACQSDVRVSISRILNPPVASAECLGSYDFGPSGIDFDVPVTVTIPYRFSGTGNSAKPYWYDSLTGALSQSGITDIENIVIAANLNALRFKTAHFTPFYLVSGDADATDGGSISSGGCSVSAAGRGSPKDLIVPYAIVTMAIVVLRHRDRKKRRSCETTQG